MIKNEGFIKIGRYFHTIHDNLETRLNHTDISEERKYDDFSCGTLIWLWEFHVYSREFVGDYWIIFLIGFVDTYLPGRWHQAFGQLVRRVLSREACCTDPCHRSHQIRFLLTQFSIPRDYKTHSQMHVDWVNLLLDTVGCKGHNLEEFRGQIRW